MTKTTRLLILAGLSTAWILATASTTAQSLSPIEQLGKELFFDTDLSSPSGQSCAACHGEETGFTGPEWAINLGGAVYPGAVPSRFGNRKPPASAYGGDSPILDLVNGVWTGGMFWDGRATGWQLDDPLAEQALGPFLNPLEQNMPHARQVILRVKKSGYAGLFEEVWGPGSLNDDKEAIDATYVLIGRSIAAYERSAEVNPFSSKYDAYLRGEVELSAQETLGLELFEGAAMCVACHPSRPGPGGEPPLFTDFTYDNLGVPRNPMNPFYSASHKVNPDGFAWVDPGLGGFLASAGYPEDVWMPEFGKQKVPTLRNVDKRPYRAFVKAYTHNGVFKTLDDVVHFYNTRDVDAWPPPEVPENVNHDELGNLGLTAVEEAAIVAFMKTLSDGYVVPMMRRRR